MIAAHYSADRDMDLRDAIQCAELEWHSYNSMDNAE
jgi:hypothetical protein